MSEAERQAQAAVAPIIAYRGKVLPDWIDQNRHMTSMAYPNLFHPNSAALFNRLGIDLAYMLERKLSVFQREFHLAYERELMLGDPIEIRSWLVAYDAKRIHHFHELWHATKAYRAATVEYMSLHIDMTTRRTAPFPEDVRRRLEALAADFAGLALPSGPGARIGIPARS